MRERERSYVFLFLSALLFLSLYAFYHHCIYVSFFFYFCLSVHVSFFVISFVLSLFSFPFLPSLYIALFYFFPPLLNRLWKMLINVSIFFVFCYCYKLIMNILFWNLQFNYYFYYILLCQGLLRCLTLLLATSSFSNLKTENKITNHAAT